MGTFCSGDIAPVPGKNGIVAEPNLSDDDGGGGDDENSHVDGAVVTDRISRPNKPSTSQPFLRLSSLYSPGSRCCPVTPDSTSKKGSLIPSLKSPDTTPGELQLLPVSLSSIYIY
ncbi:unnamed protein product [Protopolystoma xenopodis]|uniref:Uncharacterized protein n=1 Tax=Protopolystoma xenopodis TaxID=117903 RepID=A0A448X4A5_9PLAT|nr:unnamed protein product [Protopolystoma xenopodis]